MNHIDSVIVHKLVKEKHGKAAVVERPTALAVDGPATKLVFAIHDLYASKTSKGYGRFQADEVNYPSAAILRNCVISKQIDFVQASKQLLGVLASKASTAALATGGYVVMAHMTNAANVSWFIVAIINNVDGSVINDATLEVTDAMHVDMDNLRVAGRVNLTDWQSGNPETRYVGFLKQRGEVADYFKLFLGCDELVADTEETKKLVEVLKKFAKSEGLDQQAEEDFLQAAFSHCNEKNKNDEPLSLEALSNAVWPDEPQKLQKMFVEGELQISDGFVPDGRSIRALMRMKYKTEFWSVDIDRSALSKGYAHYNQKKGELTLLNLPDGLKAELDREVKDA